MYVHTHMHEHYLILTFWCNPTVTVWATSSTRQWKTVKDHESKANMEIQTVNVWVVRKLPSHEILQAELKKQACSEFGCINRCHWSKLINLQICLCIYFWFIVSMCYVARIYLLVIKVILRFWVILVAFLPWVRWNIDTTRVCVLGAAVGSWLAYLSRNTDTGGAVSLGVR